MADQDRRSPDKPGQIGTTVQLVKDYARQETIGPLRNAGRFVAFGLAGAALLGVATVLLVLGTLRMIQAEFAPTFSGRWFSLLPYVIVLVLAALVIAVAASRIGRPTTLDPSRPPASPPSATSKESS